MFKSIFKILKRRWYLVLPIFVVLGILAYHFASASSQLDKKNLYTVKRRTLTENLSLSGAIDAEEKTTLRFQTSGRLSWVGVKVGDYVKKYQGIAALDQQEVKKTLDKYLNDYLKTRWDFEQTKDTYKDSIITSAIKRILDKSQFDLNKSVLDVEVKNLSVEFANLWTPIEGIVTKVDAPYAGVNITPAQAEFEVVNPQTIYFSATADQNDVVKLTTDLAGNIVLDAYPQQEFSGQIRQISFAPKQGETGTVYEVKMSFDQDNSGYRYRLKMTGDANFVVRKKENVLAVPTNLAKTENGKKYVFKQEGGNKKKVYIKEGEEIGDFLEVKEGLAEGDIIL